MSAFIRKVGFFLILVLIYKVLIALGLMISLNSDEANNFFGQNTNKSKIIIAGASNIKYNYDFKYLNEVLHNYDVVGCSLSEPSGLFAIISKLDNLNLTENDVVVLSLPHSLYEAEKFLPIRSNKKQGYSMGLVNASANAFPNLTFKSLFIDAGIKDLYNNLETDLRKTTQTEIEGFSLKPSEQKDKKFINCDSNPKSSFYIKSIGNETEYIRKVFSYFQTRLKARIIFRFPALMENEFNVDVNRLTYLKKNLSFINTFESSCYDKNEFFDQWYHLNKCGMQLSTEKFVSEIKPYLKKDRVSP